MKTTGSKKIAERYVNAVFEVASQASSLGEVEKDFALLRDILEKNSDFRDFLHNPLLSRGAQGKIAGNLLEKLAASKITSQFVTLLARNKRLDILPQIIDIFLEKTASSRGEISAELVTAKPLSDSDAKKIAGSLGKAYGKKVNLNIREDSSLLGGTVINIGSYQLDGSLAGKLNRLKQALKTA